MTVDLFDTYALGELSVNVWLSDVFRNVKIWNPVQCENSYSTHTLRHEQNGRHFADDALKSISLNEDCCVFI